MRIRFKGLLRFVLSAALNRNFLYLTDSKNIPRIIPTNGRKLKRYAWRQCRMEKFPPIVGMTGFLLI